MDGHSGRLFVNAITQDAQGGLSSCVSQTMDCPSNMNKGLEYSYFRPQSSAKCLSVQLVVRVKRNPYRLVSKKHIRHLKRRVAANPGIDKTSFPESYPALSILLPAMCQHRQCWLWSPSMAVHALPSTSCVVVHLLKFWRGGGYVEWLCP